MDRLLYAIPQHVTAIAPAYATHYAKNQKTAERLLNNMFDED